MKPVVKCKNASIIDMETGTQFMICVPVDHPSPHISNTKEVVTSKIVKIEGNVVETQNTEYHVENWQ